VRYFKKHQKVFFNVGLDEHGSKIYQCATAQGLSPQTYVDQLKAPWINFCQRLNIGYDNFYRTSDPKHHKLVQKLWTKALKKGDLYQKSYTGLYCVGCERFITNKELVDGRCPEHPNLEIQEISETNWFFRLSKYKTQLQDWFRENPDFLIPKNKTGELNNLIEQIEDISVSRDKNKLPWGVDVPNDTTQVIYVWFDALINYIGAIKLDKKKWQNSIQICGPDNLRFQAVIWQGLLKSFNFSPTYRLLIHGTVLDEQGRKMSKSWGNVIDPLEQLEKYGLEAIRYYTLSLPTTQNCNWDEKQLVKLYNAHLVDNYGNLISRVLHLIDKYNFKPFTPGKEFKNRYERLFAEIDELWQKLEISQALQKITELIKSGNAYINEHEPWKDKFNNYVVLSDLYWLLQQSVKYYEPIIPHRIEEIKTALVNKKKVILFKKIK
jgi:methionyl-tRNA synthetase